MDALDVPLVVTSSYFTTNTPMKFIHVMCAQFPPGPVRRAALIGARPDARTTRAMRRRRARPSLALATLVLARLARAWTPTGRVRTTTHDDVRISPLVVVALDGVVRAVDARTGDDLWDFDSGGPVLGAAFGAERTSGRVAIGSRGAGARRVFPGADGALYGYRVDANGERVVRRLPVTTKELVEASPSATADGGLVVGRRSSTIYALDARTGALVRSVDVDGTTSVARELSAAAAAATDGSDDGGRSEELVYVGRTEYVVRSVDAASGEERWNVTHGELRSLSRDENTGALKIGTDRAIIESESFAIAPGNVLQSVDTKTGKVRWAKKLSSLPLGVSDVNGHVVVENLAQVRPETDDRIIIGAHEGGLYALPYTAGVGADLPDGADSSNALVPSSGGNRFVRVDVRNDEDDWACIPEALVKATLDKSRDQAKIPGSKARASMNAALAGGASIIIIVYAQTRRNEKRKENESVDSAEGDDQQQLSAAAKKRAKKRAKQAEARAAEAELAAKIRDVTEDKTRDETRVGRLLIKPSVLGYGSCGTIVFEGELDGRRVAVKRLLAQFHELARKELAALIASDEHPNILRCFALEEDSNFVYMALELCASSLARLVDPVSAAGENKSDIKCVDETGYPTPECLRILHDVVSGLSALHEQGIVHRDLKPQNVLITSSGRGKIADMGLAKRVNVAEGTSFETHVVGGPNANNAAGTSGWQAPERLTQGRQSRSVDVFSFGCLTYYATTGGSHPFGSKLQRDANVMANKFDLSKLAFFPEAAALVRACIDADPAKRPSAKNILSHPMWWEAEKKIQFLIDASDRVELEDRVSDRTLLRELESRARGSIGCEDWTKKLDAALLENMGRYREYDGSSVRDLLRVIRNKANHYRELPPKLQRALGSYPDGFWRYLSARFPELLLGVRDFFAPFAASEPTLAKYFSDAASIAVFTPPLARAEPVTDAPLIAPQVFPHRPGRELCDFYMKTGRCKFGATCKFHHPSDAGHWDVMRPTLRNPIDARRSDPHAPL